MISFSFCTFSFGQDFSFDELVKLRSYTYPAFETYVHDKGYKLNHLEYNERCTVFRNGKSVVSYCHYYDDGYSYHNHVAIKFETSSKEINQLQHNIIWGHKGNFVDVPTDCPQRDERLGWTGDAQAFVSTAAFNMDIATFFSKWMKDIAADQFENGNILFLTPSINENCALLDYKWNVLNWFEFAIAI